MEAIGYSVLFLISFAMAVLGTYFKGMKDGKKELLDDLFEKGDISSGTYIRFNNIIEKRERKTKKY